MDNKQTSNQITVILTPLDAELFKQWQEFHSTFALLVEKGVFDIKYGKATLNFLNGELQNITKEEIVWKR